MYQSIFGIEKDVVGILESNFSDDLQHCIHLLQENDVDVILFSVDDLIFIDRIDVLLAATCLLNGKYLLNLLLLRLIN